MARPRLYRQLKHWQFNTFSAHLNKLIWLELHTCIFVLYIQDHVENYNYGYKFVDT
jgi:hypothetical protein